MKILHIANFNLLKTNGCSQNSMQIKITNGLTRLGHHVIHYSDRDICRMFGFGHMNFWGRKKINEHLLKFAKDVRPEAIIIGHADTIDTETLLEIKKVLPGIKILEWCVDNMAEIKGAPQAFNDDALFTRGKLLKKQPATDIILLTTGCKKALNLLKTDSNVVGFFPNIVDKSIETGAAYEQTDLPYDLLFAATPTLLRQFCGDWLEIDDIAQHIQDHVPGLKPLFAGMLGNPKIHASHYQQACETCAMGLSISHANEIYLYQSDRMAHMMGNGEMIFLDAKSGYKDFFTDDEIAFYATPEELYQKIIYYKNNPLKRQQLAKAGHDKYVELFNEKTVAGLFVDLLNDIIKEDVLREKYPWAQVVTDRS